MAGAVPNHAQQPEEPVIDTTSESPHRPDFPGLSVDPVVVRDIELGLFGLLPDEQLLGGSVRPAGDEAVLDRNASAVVSLAVPDAVAQQALSAGGLTLEDEERTPLARLHLVPQEPAHDAAGHTGTPQNGWTTLRGTLQRVRHRESGHARRHALSAQDLSPGQEQVVVVLSRPPMRADVEEVAAALSPSSAPVVVIVADDPRAQVPAAVMLDLARTWLAELDLATPATVRTAPLASRDVQSDRALAERLGSALNASVLVHLAPGDGSPGAAAWTSARDSLIKGEGTDIPGLAPAAAARLTRWRPPRDRRGLVLMFSGFSGSGKSTVARDLAEWVTDNTARTVSLLDGDVVRAMLSSGLGFNREGRELNVRRIGYVGAEIARHGGIAICAPIAPYEATRHEVREMVEAVGDFVLVHVSTPLEECERRDLKGLYAKARAGLIPEFTGVSDPYETPLDAELSVDTSTMSRQAALDVVLDYLRDGGWLPRETGSTA